MKNIKNINEWNNPDPEGNADERYKTALKNAEHNLDELKTILELGKNVDLRYKDQNTKYKREEMIAYDVSAKCMEDLNKALAKWVEHYGGNPKK